MLETYFSAVKILEHLRKGPSGLYMDGFAASLERSGYRPATAVRYRPFRARAGRIGPSKPSFHRTCAKASSGRRIN
jgi:hypothetical protein